MTGRAFATAKAQMARLCAAAPDLAKLVEEGRITLSGGLAALRVRQRRADAYKQISPWERELRRVLTAEQWREHEAFIRRRDVFDALPMSEKIEMARWVLAVDPDLAVQVKNGFIPLFEAYHELKQAEAFVSDLRLSGRLP